MRKISVAFILVMILIISITLILPKHLNLDNSDEYRVILYVTPSITEQRELDSEQKKALFNIINGIRLEGYYNSTFTSGDLKSYTFTILKSNGELPYHLYHNQFLSKTTSLVQIKDKLYKVTDLKIIDELNKFLKECGAPI